MGSEILSVCKESNILFPCGNVEMPTRYPSGDFRWAAKYVNLQYREQGLGYVGISHLTQLCVTYHLKSLVA